MEDWEVDDEALDTEIEDLEYDVENSPRVSLNSVILALDPVGKRFVHD
jgi:hypothetical protein